MIHPQRRRDEVIGALEEGLSLKDAAHRTGVAYQTVVAWAADWRQGRRKPRRRGGGGQAKLPEIGWFRELIDKNPGITLVEICEHAREDRRFQLHPSTARSFLAKNDFASLSLHPPEREPILCEVCGYTNYPVRKAAASAEAVSAIRDPSADHVVHVHPHEQGRKKVIEALEDGLSVAIAAERAGVKYFLALKWAGDWRRGCLEPKQRGGYRARIRLPEIGWFRSLIEHEPNITLVEICDRIFDDRGFRFHPTSLRKFLASHHITFMLTRPRDREPVICDICGHTNYLASPSEAPTT